MLCPLGNLHAWLDRWGNAKSPAYGTLSDYQFMRRHSASQKWLEKAKAAWGASLSSVADVIAVFVNYCSGQLLCGDGGNCSPVALPNVDCWNFKAALHERAQCVSLSHAWATQQRGSRSCGWVILLLGLGAQADCLQSSAGSHWHPVMLALQSSVAKVQHGHVQARWMSCPGARAWA